jgi:hypothetical protein
MKKVSFFLLMAFSMPAIAQFKYSAWNVGPEIGNFKITNGFSRYAQNGPNANDVFLADSANSHYSITNARVDIEDVRTNFFVKVGASFPLGKHPEKDSAEILGKHFEVNFKVGGGFVIKERVGFQFGFNFGSFGVRQIDNAANTKFDYFVPSAGTTPLDGQHMFGTVAAFRGGFLVSNIIAFTDNLALQTTYSHNNIVHKRQTVNGRNDELTFTLFYANEDSHNIGFSVNVIQEWMHFKGYTPEDATRDSGFARIYPPTKVSMFTIYFGINIPIVFDE